MHLHFQLTKFICFVYFVTAQSTPETSPTSINRTAFASTETGPEFDSVTFNNGVVSGVLTASVSSRRRPRPSPSPTPYPVDFNSTSASLRTFIFQSNVAGAARVLSSKRLLSLGAGLTYPESLAALVVKSQERNKDPDVVAFKALALSALNTGEATKLATAVVLSLQPNCKCQTNDDIEQLDEVRLAFEELFKDKEALREIVDANANIELTRKLLSASGAPTYSFVCAHCWPKKCKKIMNWCS
eukprot:g9212.t1